MKTTQADVLFHMYHSMPKWARDVVNQKPKSCFSNPLGLPFHTSIDACINGRSGEAPTNKKDNINSLSNTISLLKLAISNMKHRAGRSYSKVIGMDDYSTAEEYMEMLAKSKGSCKSSDRSVWATRFLRGLRRATNRA